MDTNRHELDSTKGQMQLNLRLPNGVTFEKKNLILPDNLSYKDWLQVGSLLSSWEESIEFWKSKWDTFGKSHYTREQYAEGLAILGLQIQNLRNALVIESVGFVEPALDDSHHFVLGRAKLDEVGKRMWADIAVKEGLRAAELQESIKKGTVVRIKQEPNDGAAGVSTFQGLAMQFDLLRRQIGDKWKDWSAAEIDQVMAKMGRILDFITTLQIQKRELEQRGGSSNAG